MFGPATFEPGKSFQSIMMGGLLSLTVVMVLLPSVVTCASLSSPRVKTDVPSVSVMTPLFTVMFIDDKAGEPVYWPPLIVTLLEAYIVPPAGSNQFLNVQI